MAFGRIALCGAAAFAVLASPAGAQQAQPQDPAQSPEIRIEKHVNMMVPGPRLRGDTLRIFKPQTTQTPQLVGPGFDTLTVLFAPDTVYFLSKGANRRAVPPYLAPSLRLLRKALLMDPESAGRDE